MKVGIRLRLRTKFLHVFEGSLDDHVSVLISGCIPDTDIEHIEDHAIIDVKFTV